MDHARPRPARHARHRKWRPPSTGSTAPVTNGAAKLS